MRPPEKVTFTFLKVTFSDEKMTFTILKVTFSALKVTFSYINIRINIHLEMAYFFTVPGRSPVRVRTKSAAENCLAWQGWPVNSGTVLTP